MPEQRPSDQARVVIVGGGIMGAATAYHLARAGVTDVVLLEAGDLAGGSSGKPLGGVRAQFSDPTNIELGLRSLRAFEGFADEFGADIGLQRVGYLFAIRDPADIARFEASIGVQNSLGVPSRLITPAEAVALCPHLDRSSVVAAAWSPGDGFARPVAAVTALASAAAGLGVRIRTGVAVSGIDVGAAGRALVHTSQGDSLTAEAVVCTAGAWSRQIGAMVGVDLPIEPLRRQIVFTEPLRDRAHVPFTIDYSTTAYFHASPDGGLLLGWADPAEVVGFDRAVTTGWHEGLRSALRSFAPSIADLPLAAGWAGLYEMTPDCNALIGEADAGFRFLYAAGFSGHGFLQGPAVGEAVADLYLGRSPAVDVSGFDARRFEHAAVRTELGII